jgi:hypothetical protein
MRTRAGKLTSITYFQATGGTELKLYLEPQGGERREVGKDLLFHD